MRIRAGLVLGLLLAFGMAGCGGTGDGDGDGVATAGSSAGATSTTKPDQRSDQEAALEYAKCMREQGINMPDPQVGDDGAMVLRMPAPEGGDKEQAKEKVEAAEQQCKRYLPNGGEPPPMDPQAMEQMRKFSQCMRENGVPKFPDPTENGLSVDSGQLGMDPEDPRMTKAEEACAKYNQPAPGEGGQGPSTDSQTGGNP
jgi:hypothetical protein